MDMMENIQRLWRRQVLCQEDDVVQRQLAVPSTVYRSVLEKCGTEHVEKEKCAKVVGLLCLDRYRKGRPPASIVQRHGFGLYSA